MIQFYNISVQNVMVHFVGNKSIDEGIKCSKNILVIDDVVKDVLTNYFIKSFLNKDDFSIFNHESDLNLNEVYTYISKILIIHKIFILSLLIWSNIYMNKVHIPK